MCKFKVGDRVAVYGYNQHGAFSAGHRGEVLMSSSLTLRVFWDDADYEASWVHPKQCRRLKRKKKAGVK